MLILSLSSIFSYHIKHTILYLKKISVYIVKKKNWGMKITNMSYSIGIHQREVECNAEVQE